MAEFNTWEEASEFAWKRAKTTSYDQGIRHNKLFNEWSVHYIPSPENRSGWELQCEVIPAQKERQTQS